MAYPTPHPCRRNHSMCCSHTHTGLNKLSKYVIITPQLSERMLPSARECNHSHLPLSSRRLVSPNTILVEEIAPAGDSKGECVQDGNADQLTAVDSGVVQYRGHEPQRHQHGMHPWTAPRTALFRLHNMRLKRYLSIIEGCIKTRDQTNIS